MLRPEEVEMLVCGNPDFDMRALCTVTTYDGFSRKDITIKWEGAIFLFFLFSSFLILSHFTYSNISDLFS